MAEPARKAVDGTESIPVRSRRFGEYEVPADRLLHFPEGLIGFPQARRFVLLDATRPDAPFRRLLCVDEPELGFVVCDPEALWPGYGGALPPYEGGRENLAVLAIITIPKNPLEMTANLMAPLVVDCRTRVGRQLVLDIGRFSTRHALLPPADGTTGQAAERT